MPHKIKLILIKSSHKKKHTMLSQNLYYLVVLLQNYSDYNGIYFINDYKRFFKYNNIEA